jgi:hypothetical protein
VYLAWLLSGAHLCRQPVYPDFHAADDLVAVTDLLSDSRCGCCPCAFTARDSRSNRPDHEPRCLRAAEHSCYLARHTNIALSKSAAPLLGPLQLPACALLRRPSHHSHKPPGRQIAIDGDPYVAHPRVPSLEAFGRRPQSTLLHCGGPASETLHIITHTPRGQPSAAERPKAAISPTNRKSHDPSGPRAIGTDPFSRHRQRAKVSCRNPTTSPSR